MMPRVSTHRRTHHVRANESTKTPTTMAQDVIDITYGLSQIGQAHEVLRGSNNLSASSIAFEPALRPPPMSCIAAQHLQSAPQFVLPNSARTWEQAQLTPARRFPAQSLGRCPKLTMPDHPLRPTSAP